MTIGASQSDSYYDAPDEPEDQGEDGEYPDWVDTLEDHDEWANS